LDYGLQLVRFVGDCCQALLAGSLEVDLGAQ
jgi:hypothetical protein